MIEWRCVQIGSKMSCALGQKKLTSDRIINGRCMWPGGVD